MELKDEKRKNFENLEILESFIQTDFHFCNIRCSPKRRTFESDFKQV